MAAALNRIGLALVRGAELIACSKGCGGAQPIRAAMASFDSPGAALRCPMFAARVGGAGTDSLGESGGDRKTMRQRARACTGIVSQPRQCAA